MRANWPTVRWRGSSCPAGFPAAPTRPGNRARRSGLRKPRWRRRRKEQQMTYILGGWQSDFARNYAREGLEIGDGFAEAVNGALAETGLEPEDIDVGHV